MFLERRDGEVVRAQDGVADGGHAGEQGFGVGGRGARQRLDEGDVRGGGLVAGVEADDAEGHGGGWKVVDGGLEEGDLG